VKQIHAETLAALATIAMSAPIEQGYYTIRMPRTPRGNKYRTGNHVVVAEQPIVRLRGSARNKPCPCGSGIKAKKCGRKTRKDGVK
jgi:hypothetical protein